MRDLLSRAASALWGGVRGAISWLWRWFREEQWSARTVAILGLLLAVVSAIEQGFFSSIINPSENDECKPLEFGLWSTCWNEWSGWVTLGLTLALLAASAWFGADISRIRKWSALATELQARSLDVESLHPDALTGALATMHDPVEALDLRKELQEIVAELNTSFAEGKGPPSPTIERLETAATRAVGLSEQRSAAAVDERTPETDVAWESVTRLLAASRRASFELKLAQKRRSNGKSESSVSDEDPRQRWTQLVATATVLVGLIAAPGVADELTGDDENGAEPAAFKNLEDEINKSLQSQMETRLTPVLDDLEDLETSVEGMDDRLDGHAESAALTRLEDRVALLEQQAPLLVGLPSQFGTEVEVEPGDSIWELVEERCSTDAARSTANRVIRTWDANVEIVGSNPDQIDVEQILIILCGSGTPTGGE